MVRKMLTDRGLRTLSPAPPGKRRITWDAAVPGLGVRSTDKNHHSFVLVVRYPGSRNPTPKTLGDIGAISLEDARSKAREHLALIRQGLDPKADAERKRQAELRKQKHTFEAVVEVFIAKHTTRLRTGAGIARDLRNEFVNRWGKRPISEIDRFDVLSVIEAKVDAGARHQARNLLAHIRKFFGWAISRGVYGIEHSPCANIKPADLVGAPPSGTVSSSTSNWPLSGRQRASCPTPSVPYFVAFYSQERGAMRSHLPVGTRLIFTAGCSHFPVIGPKADRVTFSP